jgi:hypothetical protein
LGSSEPPASPAGDTDAWYGEVAVRVRQVTGRLTYSAIGARTGTHPETVRRYLAGARPCARFLAALCLGFAVDPSWLFLGIDSRTPALDVKPLPAPARARLNVEVTFKAGRVQIVRTSCRQTVIRNGRRRRVDQQPA